MKLRFAFLIALSLLTACSYHLDKGATSGNPGATTKPSQIPDFETVYARVLGPACARCHDGGDLSDLTKYASVHASLAEIRDRVTRTDSLKMPKRGTLSADELSLLLAWIDAGGPEVVGKPAPAPTPASTPAPAPESSPTPAPTETPSFAEVTAKVFATSCARCHDGEDHFDINNEETTRALARDIVDRIRLPEGTRGRMPPKAVLTSEQIAIVEAWARGL